MNHAREEEGGREGWREGEKEKERVSAIKIFTYHYIKYLILS